MKTKVFSGPTGELVLLLLGGFLLACALYARVRLLNIPFERDEGIFAYIGQHLWSGGHLYRDFPDNKLPGLYLIYAYLTRFFGILPTGLHTALLLLQLGAVFILYKLALPFLGKGGAWFCAGIFALYSAAPQVAGFALHATQLLVLPALAGVWALVRTEERPKQVRALYLAAGLCFGAAFCIKQQAFFYLPVGLIWIVFQQKKPQSAWIDAGLYVLGALMPYTICCLYFMTTGSWEDFWFWTVTLPTTQTGAGGKEAMAHFVQFSAFVSQYWWGVWALAIVGTGLLLQDKQFGPGLLLPASLGATALGAAFYPHYFVLCLPWVALGAIYALRSFGKKRLWVAVVLGAMTCIWPIAAQPGYWFYTDPNAVLRQAYGMNPFPEMQEIGRVLKEKTRQEDKILVFGSEPELYLYADRASATRHLFLPIGLRHKRSDDFEREYLQEWNMSQPRFVVFPNVFADQNRENPLFQQGVALLRQDYHTAGIVDLYPDHTEYNWSPLPGSKTKSPNWIIIFERN